MRFSVYLLLAALCSGSLVESRGARAQSGITYVKQATRDETKRASLAASGFVVQWPSNWRVIGPFPDTDNQGVATVHPVETAPFDEKAEFAGSHGPVKWRNIDLPDGQIHKVDVFAPGEAGIVYLHRRLVSNRQEKVRVSLGSRGGIGAYVGKRTLVAKNADRATAPDSDFVTLDLKQGAIDLLVKLVSVRGEASFYFRPELDARFIPELEDQLDRDFPAEGEAASYRMRPLPLPTLDLIEVGGLAFRDDGKLLVCTRRGEIWLVANPTSEDRDAVKWTRFAHGLHETLGIRVVGKDVYVAQRPELTRLRDTDGDDVADEFRTICDKFGVSGNYHEFHYGPVRDAAGNLFVTLNLGFGAPGKLVPWRGCCMKIAPDGTITPWAFGLRSPNGLNTDPLGRMYYTDNQGEYIPVCKLQEIRQGEFYGHRVSLPWMSVAEQLAKGTPGEKIGVDEGSIGIARPADVPPLAPDRVSNTVTAVTPLPEPDYIQPAIWFPYSLARSATEMTWDTSGGKFGPFAGHCFVGELTNSLIVRCALEEVKGRMQGACFLFRKDFTSGPNRLAQAGNGTMFVGQTNRGWGSIGGESEGVQRLVYTGRVPYDMHSMSITPDGWLVKFTKPVDPVEAAKPERYFVESYTYHYWSTYGSPEIERKSDEIARVEVQPDGQSVLLTVPNRAKRRVYHLHVKGLPAADGSRMLPGHDHAYYTLNELP